MRDAQVCEKKISDHKRTIRSIAVTAACAAAVFACTFICIPGPRGGFVHFGNAPLFIAAIVLGSKRGALAGAAGMALYDVVMGYLLWAPFTFIIRFAMGLIVGAMTKNKKTFMRSAAAVGVASAVMIAGYYAAEIVIYGSFAAPVASIPGNIAQLVLGGAIALAALPALKKAAVYDF